MKRTIFVMVMVVAALAIVGTGVAFAQTPQPPTPGNGFGMGRMHGYSAAGLDGPLHEYMVNAMAGALGISTIDFEARRDAGKTAYQIALDLGIAADKIPALLSDAHLKALDAAVAAKAITQQQADWMKSRPAAMGLGNCNGTGQFMGGGMGRGWRSQPANP